MNEAISHIRLLLRVFAWSERIVRRDIELYLRLLPATDRKKSRSQQALWTHLPHSYSCTSRSSFLPRFDRPNGRSGSDRGCIYSWKSCRNAPHSPAVCPSARESVSWEDRSVAS